METPRIEKRLIVVRIKFNNHRVVNTGMEINLSKIFVKGLRSNFIEIRFILLNDT